MSHTNKELRKWKPWLLQHFSIIAECGIGIAERGIDISSDESAIAGCGPTMLSVEVASLSVQLASVNVELISLSAELSSVRRSVQLLILILYVNKPMIFSRSVNQFSFRI